MLINCCHDCKNKNGCEGYEVPVCIPGIDCKDELISIDGQITHKGCIICYEFKK